MAKPVRDSKPNVLFMLPGGWNALDRASFASAHFHTLIYKRLMRWAIGSKDAAVLTKRNSMTAPYLWVLCSLSVVPSVLWWDDSGILGLWIGTFMVSYVLLYSRIVRFKTPRVLIVKDGAMPPRKPHRRSAR